jgi:hypothetical protein
MKFATISWNDKEQVLTMLRTRNRALVTQAQFLHVFSAGCTLDYRVQFLWPLDLQEVFSHSVTGTGSSSPVSFHRRPLRLLHGGLPLSSLVVLSLLQVGIGCLPPLNVLGMSACFTAHLRFFFFLLC